MLSKPLPLFLYLRQCKKEKSSDSRFKVTHLDSYLRRSLLFSLTCFTGFFSEIAVSVCLTTWTQAKHLSAENDPAKHF